MSRSSASETDGPREGRAQTEPLAAIFALAVMALGLGIYAGYVTDVLPGTSERAVEQPTLDRVWAEIETNGVYDPSTTSLEDVPARALPQGFSVRITVTRVDDDGRIETVDAVTFGPEGGVSTVEPPDDARRASRSIPIRRAPGVVDGGTLEVVVWE